MHKVEITMEKRIALEFEVTDDEYEVFDFAELPDRIQEEFNRENWKDAEQDFAIYDVDKCETVVDWG